MSATIHKLVIGSVICQAATVYLPTTKKNNNRHNLLHNGNANTFNAVTLSTAASII